MKILNVFVWAGRGLYKNPVIIIPSVVLFLLLAGMSKISVAVNYKLQNTFSITAWLVFFVLASLAIMSFFFSGIIGMCKDAVHGKKEYGRFFNYASKFWFRNLQIMIVIALLGILIYYASFFLGGLTVDLLGKYSVIIFSGLMFIGLAGGIIFLTFASPFLIIEDKSAFLSMKKSALFVRKNYFDSLTIIIIFFVIMNLLNFVKSPFAEIIEAVFVVPYLAFVLTRAALEK